MTSCRFETIANGAQWVPRSCPACGLGPCKKGLADPYKKDDVLPHTFELGQVTRMRSGGPSMTVISKIALGTYTDGIARVHCCWFSDGGTYNSADLPVAALTGN